MKLRRITGLIKTSGIIHEFEEMRKGDSPAGEITGGTVGALGGAAGGMYNMTQTAGGLKDMAAANTAAKGLTGAKALLPLAGVAAKRVLPWALVLGALGTLAGGKLQDAIRRR